MKILNRFFQWYFPFSPFWLSHPGNCYSETIRKDDNIFVITFQIYIGVSGSNWYLTKFNREYGNGQVLFDRWYEYPYKTEPKEDICKLIEKL